jgi:hypothetical protein
MEKKKGRPVEYRDTYHEKWREKQTAYNHEVATICKEFGCSIKRARLIRKQRKAKQELENYKER